MTKIFCYTFLVISAVAFITAIMVVLLQREGTWQLVLIGFISSIISGLSAAASIEAVK